MGPPENPAFPGRKKMARQQGLFSGATPYLFVAPALIVLAFTCLYPVIKGFELSFFDWKLGTPIESRKFVGWENFIWAWNDPALFNSIKVTIIFAVSAVSVELLSGSDPGAPHGKRH